MCKRRISEISSDSPIVSRKLSSSRARYIKHILFRGYPCLHSYSKAQRPELIPLLIATPPSVILNFSFAISLSTSAVPSSAAALRHVRARA